MSKPLRVLIVEDSEDDAQLILHELKCGGFEPNFERVDTPEAMQTVLDKQAWDIILSDYVMPRFSGLEALKIVKEKGLDLPFIIISGKIGEDVAVGAMKAGAHDYLMKGNLKRLSAVVERELREAQVRAAHRNAEEQLQMTERLRLLGEMAASIMHDLKNPMQIVLGTAEILDTDNLAPSRRSKHCQMIVQQVKRMVSLTQDILDFAKDQLQITPQPVNIEEFCQELVNDYQSTLPASGINVTYIHQLQKDGSPLVLLDAERIRRVLVNLIDNAKDAMPKGGEIKLTSGLSKQALYLKVEDTGMGIPEKIRDSIFKAFVTYGKCKGTGLGLSVVQKIVEAHKGWITFASTPGAGTTFTVTLPQSIIKEREPSLIQSG